MVGAYKLIRVKNLCPRHEPGERQEIFCPRWREMAAPRLPLSPRAMWWWVRELPWTGLHLRVWGGSRIQGDLTYRNRAWTRKEKEIEQDPVRRRDKYGENGGKMGWLVAIFLKTRGGRGRYTAPKKHHRDQPHSSENIIFFKNNTKALHTNRSTGWGKTACSTLICAEVRLKPQLLGQEAASIAHAALDSLTMMSTCRVLEFARILLSNWNRNTALEELILVSPATAETLYLLLFAHNYLS